MAGAAAARTLPTMLLQAPHCPGCGAPIDVPVGATRVTCTYCSCKLVVEARRISTEHPGGVEASSERAEYPEPEATLWTSETPHFELSVVEQIIPGAVKAELFRGVELDEGRFAFVSLRVVDKDSRPVAHPLEPAFETLRESLEGDGDPGLSANLALETLTQKPFDHRLECGIVLFEPHAMRAVVYGAGLRDGVLWASSEEGRTITAAGHHEALERKMLREAGDHFSNRPPIQLASGDLVLIPSAGFVARGARGGDFGALRALHEVTGAHLGEEPLRIVTLAKNAFWKARRDYGTDEAPVGDVRIAAVRAVPPPLAQSLPDRLVRRVLKSRRFEVALMASDRCAIELFDLKNDRKVIVWLSSDRPLPEGAMSTASRPILALLDGETGDNENPRHAGREALDALGSTDDAGIKIAVIQLFDEYERVKYFRRGWKPPMALGPRGLRTNYELMAFDEGGEVTVSGGARLFFPGALPYERAATTSAALAETWRGGKSSRLYTALGDHWKTKKSDAALGKIALAALSDEPRADLVGLGLVTSLTS